MLLPSPGRVVIHSLNSPENYAFDLKRPMKAIALEPGFAKKSSRAFVCGGMAGTLILHEKGWLGHKEQVLHSGEGPIYSIEWRENLIAWANDLVSGHSSCLVSQMTDTSRWSLTGSQDLRHTLITAHHLYRQTCGKSTS